MITTNLASQFRLLHLQRGRSVQWSLMSIMRTTKKKRTLSTSALPWKKHEFSRFPMRPGGNIDRRKPSLQENRGILMAEIVGNSSE
ncbi:hypothetical protein F2Q70_00004574 [Brassica cretica]|uniref:Uncharacterized protein n=1 Tax=Brassica cretica TaxID=69181 RepID=A0A8S9IQW1_BRACR|nr:hypothetical protein F2Q70_00004574 [Brassica cretica]KAF3568434.1 hypothetical protein DY000_02016672 [Brassica cretica]